MIPTSISCSIVLIIAMLSTPIYTAVTVTSISPIEINPNGGTILKINGGNFPDSLSSAESAQLIVLTNSVNCILKNVSSTEIICLTNAVSSGGIIEVRLNKGDADRSHSFTLLKTSATITSITPNRINPALETDIVIVGSNFDDVITSNKVIIENTNTSYSTECVIETYAAAKIICKLKGIIADDYSLYVLTSTGYSNPVNLEAYSMIKSISPSNGSTAGGTVITISGGPFSTNNSETTVFIGEENETCQILNVTINEITCKTKSRSKNYNETRQNIIVNTTSLTVEKARCKDINKCTFTYLIPVTPAIYTLNSSSVSQGGLLEITGINFDSRPSGTNPIILINDRNCTVLSASRTQIVIEVPIQVNGTEHANISIYVEGRGYNDIFDAIEITTNKTDLVVSSVTPQEINLNGGTILTISGHGFPNSLAGAESGELIILAGLTACTVQETNSTVIICITKAGATAGALEVRYKNHTDNSQKLTLFATPANITSVTPNIVNPALKTEITITGINFDKDISNNKVVIENTTLEFSQECIIKTSSTTEINCTIMGVMDNSYNQFLLNSTGFYNIYVATSTGYSAPISFQARTVITNISPSNGSIAGGTLLTIRGGPFSINNSETAVFIGDKDVTCKVLNTTATKIVCQTEVPPLDSLEIAQKIHLSTNSLILKEAQCEDKTGCTFTYLSAMTPTVSDINITSDSKGTVLGITGANFDGIPSNIDPLVTIDNKNCTILSASATHIMVQIPGNISSIGQTAPLIYITGKGYAENNSTIKITTNTNSSTRYWSDTTQWPKGVIPQAGDNITIPANWTIMLDIDTSSLGTLIIEGSLYFSSSAPNLTLTAEKIWVKGQLFIGTSSIDRYNNSARILLTGLSTANTLTMNTTQLAPSNKVLAVTGNLTLYGRAVNNAYTRLQAPTTIGAKSITVPASIDWKVGDKIFVAPSQKAYSEYETRTITAINGGVITLDQPLNHYHHGAPTVTKTTPYGTLDMRAEVGLLTRNIMIEGTNQDNWGGRVYIAQITSSRGRIDLNGVEMINLGQISTKYAGLTFDTVTSSTNNGSSSSIVDSVMRDSNGWQLRVMNSTGVTIQNCIFYNAMSNNVRFEGQNTNIQFTGNLIVGTNTSNQTLESTLYSESFTKSSISRNIFAGCSEICLVSKAEDCTQNTTSAFIANTAHSGLLGWYITEGNTVCNAATNFIAYKLDVGLMTFSASESVEASNLIITDTRIGMSLNTDGYTNKTKMSVSDSYIAGASLADSSSAYSNKIECNNLTGIYIPIATNDSVRSQHTSGSSLVAGLTGIAPVAIWESTFIVKSVTFANFNDAFASDCTNNYLFSSNPSAIDSSALTSLLNLTLVNVNSNNLVSFPVVSPAFEELCNGQRCTGAQNLIIKNLDGSLLGSAVSLIPADSATIDQYYCNDIRTQSYVACKEIGWVLLAFNNIDANAHSKPLSPVKLQISQNIPAPNIIYSYDNVAYRSLVRAGLSYEINFNGIPNDFIWQLHGAQTQENITITIYLPENKIARVEDINGNVINQTLWRKEDYSVLNTNALCGANFFNTFSNTLSVRLTGDPSCLIQTRVTNSVKARIKYAIDYAGFFQHNGAALFTSLISKTLEKKYKHFTIRILTLSQGSTDIEFAIDSNEQSDAVAKTEVTTMAEDLSAAIKSGDLAITTIEGGSTILSSSVEIILRSDITDNGVIISPPSNPGSSTSEGTVKLINQENKSNIPIIVGIIAFLLLTIGLYFVYKFCKKARKNAQNRGAIVIDIPTVIDEDKKKRKVASYAFENESDFNEEEDLNHYLYSDKGKGAI